MVKQAGADTTTRNAIRDGAEWAWVPHGDACPFCRMLASNGWQKASKNLLKKGHAQHIHANCDCEFAVRFSREFDVSGYDPEAYLRQYREAGSDINNWRRIDYAANRERINAQKRAAYAAQAYRKDRGAVSEISLIRRSEEVKLSVRQVESYKTPVYVSEQATISRKLSIKSIKIPKKRLPTGVSALTGSPKSSLSVTTSCAAQSVFTTHARMLFIMRKALAKRLFKTLLVVPAQSKLTKCGI